MATADTAGFFGRRGSAQALMGAALLTAASAVTLLAEPPQPPTARPGSAAETAPQPFAPPDAAPAVLRALEAEYLSDEERRDLRIFHGQWRPEDLDTPERAARAALIRGVPGDPALMSPDADPHDRAEAMLQVGEAERALRELRDLESVRALRLRAEAYFTLGRFTEAANVARQAAERVGGMPSGVGAADVVEAVRAIALRERLVRSPNPAAEYEAMIRLLGGARSNLDRLHWPIMLAEARLLMEKDNPQQAGKALEEVLTHNPRCAEAWYLLGLSSVRSFNFAAAERAALRLDALAGDEENPRGLSPLAQVVRARAALRQRDAAGAIDLLAPVRERFPQMREPIALTAAAEAVRFNEAASRAALDEYERLSPGAAAAEFEVGAALSEARHYEASAHHLGEAASRLPNWSEPLIERGLMEMQAGRDAEARAALEAAFALDPFHKRADNSLRLVRELATYGRVESDHFIIRFKTGSTDELLAREMLGPMEASHAVVAGGQPGGIDHVPPRKTIIDLLPDHTWFAVRIAGMPDIHTIAASTGPVIAMESPREGADHLGTYDWVRVLRHEYTHTVTLSRTNNAIPHWFTEAAAVYLELAPRDYPTCQLLAGALRAGRLFDLEEINIAFVRPRRPTDRQQAYAQGHWMYEFIIDRWGGRAPLDLMDQYARGTPEDSAFQSVLGVGRDGFLELFEPWARERVIAWGMDLPEGVPTVPRLLLEETLADPTRRLDVARALGDAAWDAAGAAIGLVGDEVPEPGAEDDERDEEPQATAIELPELDGPRLERLLAERPDHPDLLELAVANALAANNNNATPEIAPLLERYAAARPVDPLPHRALARMYLRAREGDAEAAARAIPHLEFLDVREQYVPTLALELARRYASLKKFDEAMAKATRATQITPFDADVRELAATIALRAGRLEDAERHIEALIAIEPDQPVHRQRLEAVRKRRGAG